MGTLDPQRRVCTRHPDRETQRSCNRCGRPACAECLHDAAVGHQCTDCVRAGRRSATAVNGAIRSRRWRTGIDARAPYVTYLLVGLNMAAYAETAAQAHSVTNNSDSSLFVKWTLFAPRVAEGEWFRLFGSAFLHLGPLHLLTNMLCLYIVGGFVESALGRWRFLGLYLVSLLGGSTAVMMFGHNTATVGASGAIFGLFAAQALILVRVRRSPTPALVVIALNLVITISIPGISIWAHIGGLVAGGIGGLGMLFGPACLRLLQSSRRVRRWPNVVAAWVSTIVPVVVCLILIAHRVAVLRHSGTLVQ